MCILILNYTIIQSYTKRINKKQESAWIVHLRMCELCRIACMILYNSRCFLYKVPDAILQSSAFCLFIVQSEHKTIK